MLPHHHVTVGARSSVWAISVARRMWQILLRRGLHFIQYEIFLCVLQTYTPQKTTYVTSCSSQGSRLHITAKAMSLPVPAKAMSGKQQMSRKKQPLSVPNPLLNQLTLREETLIPPPGCVNWSDSWEGSWDQHNSGDKSQRWSHRERQPLQWGQLADLLPPHKLRGYSQYIHKKP